MILAFDSAAARETARSGAKASTLARLRAAGFPVPDGFVVTSDEGLTEELLRSLEDLERRTGRDARFAVRSSGFSEDSAQASFAGQYESVLDVRTADEVARAIAHCFASFSGQRARAYHSWAGTGDGGGAILVQKLVPAEAAGVAFTIDPISGARDRVVIDAAAGLGTAVVGGQVTPDGFVVMKESRTIVSRRHTRDRPCLSDDAVRAVAALAERVEHHEGAPVDIEWAWHEGVAFLLQARPITAAGQRGATPWTPPADWMPELNTPIDSRFPLYSSGNVSEILPGCVVPLTYSSFARGVEQGFRSITESVGSMPALGASPVIVGFFFHRLYLNASYFMAAADNSPGASRDTVYEDLIGPSPTRHPAWRASDLLPWRFWRGARITSRFLAMQRRLDSDVRACRTLYEESRGRFVESDPSTWPAGELVRWIAVDDASLLPVIVHLRASQFATSSFALLRSLARRWLDDGNGIVASSLVTGIGSIAGAGPAAGLYDLGRLIAGEPALVALFDREQDDARLLARAEASSDQASGRLVDGVRAFIQRFGHRGFREIDLRTPNWRERPSAVVAQVRTYLENECPSPLTIAERQSHVSREARERALARLTGWKRLVFAAVLDSARKHIAAREEMKDLLLKFLDLRRRVVAAAKVRLQAVLTDPDDIYFLLDAELAGALGGELSKTAIGSIVRRRRQDFDWSMRVEVPKVQEGVPRWIHRPDPAPGAGTLPGLAVSPGVAEGTARVVIDPTDAHLAAGEILVAPVTDVAWTPMFLHCAGLIVEVGGPLSHGSIVAREYGIPAVTAVAGATRRIRSGDRVRVDGDRGIATILDGA